MQKSKEAFKKLGFEILSVHREEKEGDKGLKKTAQKSSATFHLSSDLGNKSTKAWSPEGFDTYIVHRNGTLLAVLDGKKFDRPTPAEILKEIRKVLPKSE